MDKTFLENIQKYQTLIIGAVIVSILGFGFYWYEYRDYALEKQCEELREFESSTNPYDLYDFTREKESSIIGRYKIKRFVNVQDCLEANNL